MFRSRIFWIIIVLSTISAAGFYAYQKLYNTSNLIEHIPSNAAFVFTVNFKSLSGKLNYEKLKKMNFMQELKKVARQRSREESETVNNLLDNPFTTGINFLKDAFVFGVSKNGSEAFGLVFEISDEDDFEKFIKTLPEVKNLPAKQEHYTTVDLEEGVILVWNDNTAILLGNMREGKEKYADQLMTMENSECISSIPTFKKFISSKYDVGAYFAYDGVAELFSSKFRNIPNDYNLTGATAALTLNFEDDEIVLDTEINDPSGKLEKNNMLSENGVGKKTLSNITNDKILALGTLALNSDKLIENLRMNDEYSESISEIAKELGVGISDIETMFAGEISFCISGFEMSTLRKKEYTYNPYTYEPIVTEKLVPQVLPIIISNVQLDNMIVFNQLMARAKAIKGTKYWSLNSEGIDIYLVENGDGVTITNSLNVADRFSSQGSLNAEPSDQIQDYVTNNSAAFYASLCMEDYPVSLQDEIKQEMGTRAFQQISNVTSEMNDISITISATKIVARLGMKKGKENSLFRIINMLDEIAMAS